MWVVFVSTHGIIKLVTVVVPLEREQGDEAYLETTIAGDIPMIAQFVTPLLDPVYREFRGIFTVLRAGAILGNLVIISTRPSNRAVRACSGPRNAWLTVATYSASVRWLLLQEIATFSTYTRCSARKSGHHVHELLVLGSDGQRIGKMTPYASFSFYGDVGDP